MADEKQREAQTIAHFVKASRQALDDIPTLRDYLARRLGYGLKVKLDALCVAGTGVAPQFGGILKSGNYTAFTPTSPPSSFLDSIRQGIGQLEGSDVSPDLIVLHPNDWTSIDTSKAGGSGEYLVGQPRAATPAMLWGVPLITSSNVSQGDFLVGNFAQGATLYTRRDAQLIVGTDGNDLTKNLVTLLAEIRVTMVVVRPACFVASVAG